MSPTSPLFFGLILDHVANLDSAFFLYLLEVHSELESLVT